MSRHVERDDGTDDEDPPTILCCPITMQLMGNPVVVADGRTYERDAIQQWIDMHGTSPFTRQNLRGTAVYPNLVVKELIDGHIQKNAEIRRLREERANVLRQMQQRRDNAIRRRQPGDDREERSIKRQRSSGRGAFGDDYPEEYQIGYAYGKSVVNELAQLKQRGYNERTLRGMLDGYVEDVVTMYADYPELRRGFFDTLAN